MNTLVNTKYGMIRGVEEDGCLIFKGIPYAQPPVGDLRFRAPLAPGAFSGIYMADRYPNRSMQVPMNAPDNMYTKEFYTDTVYETPVSEDGLYLNIWAPEIVPDAKRPVFFYIHGGGFLGGTGHEVEFRTAEYAKRGIILVTINYRLGLFGYLALEELTEEDPRAVGNYATLDQIAALRWVRENIASFGGDPENVTICGQSAGAMSVQALLASRLADGLYSKAIIQSASGYPSFVANVEPLEEAYERGRKILKRAGCKSLAELRKCPVETLLDVQGKAVFDGFQSGKGLPFAPVVNGYALEESITDSIAHGHMNRVPYMIGCTKNDITVTPEELEAGMSRIHRSDLDYSMMCEEKQGNPGYVYYFKRDLPGDQEGAFHSAELWYMFGTLGKCWRPMEAADYRLSERMLDLWSSFIADGNPGGDWKLCTKADPFVMEFDI